MKRIISILALYLLIFMGCSKKEILPEESQLNTSDPAKTIIDTWFDENYTNPYNIKIKYKWDEGDMSDFGRYNFPASADKVKLVLEMFKTVWVSAYTEIGGNDFVKKIAPRELVFRGGSDVTPNGGAGAFGQAAGGKCITIFSVNSVTAKALKTRTGVDTYSGLIHHEYAHILNQIKSFDEEAYRKITPEGYTANWGNIPDSDSEKLGFVSSYARMNIGEDFAEMVRTMLTKSRTEWDDFINKIGTTEYGPAPDFKATFRPATTAQENIRKKEVLVADYFKKIYGIDIYKLQEKTQQKTTEYLNKP